MRIRGLLLFLVLGLLALPLAVSASQVPVYIAFHWHMHQPIYWPYETINETEASGGSKYSFSVAEVHNSRSGPYTTWPRNAVAMGQGTPHGGAQVSFSGSLIENLNNLWGLNWKGAYAEAKAWKTSRNNPRLDLVAFGYHHPLMGLIDGTSIRHQVAMHRRITEQTFGGAYSKGMFPPENAFSVRMVPHLVAEGIEWVMVDNIHFDRASQGYPWVAGSNLFPPNKADQRNPNPNDWKQRSGMWAPSQTSAAFGYRPHYVEHVNPQTGAKTRMIVVPTARYEGNEDGRGGFGALNYESVLSQLLEHNTDPSRPVLVVLHHDGDNFGGGTDSYYHSNFQNFVNWVSANPNFEWTTVQDYLDRFPPAANDVIHVEDGSWAGADNGDPEFIKWNGGENAQGYSYDRNSWAVITAAENRVKTAAAIQPPSGVDALISGSGNNTDKAWRFFLVGQTSCYWYWDGTENWDSHPTRAANLAVEKADLVINSQPGTDTVGPSIYALQRDPYNPGGKQWRPVNEPSDFQVWTFVYDVSGLASVNLMVRTHTAPVGDAHRIYSGGNWQAIPMSGSEYGTPLTSPLPTYRAKKYVAQVNGLSNIYADYYVEAIDTKGNVTRTEIYHVYVGEGGGEAPSDAVVFSPASPSPGHSVTVTYKGMLKGAAQVNIHWGYDGWKGVATEPMTKDLDGNWVATLAVPEAALSKFDCVFNNGAGSWDNNSGADYHANLVPWGGGDTIPPQVSFSLPAVGASLGDVLAEVAVTATDNVGVVRVEFSLGSTALGAATAAPWRVFLNPLDFANGAATLRAVAFDAAGNSAEATRQIVIDNQYGTPQVSFTIDKPAGNIVGNVAATILASVVAPAGGTAQSTISKVELFAGAVKLGTDTTAPYAIGFDSRALADGPHTLRVLATDSRGKTAEAQLAVTVANGQGSFAMRRIRYQADAQAGRNVFIQYNTGGGFNAFPGEKMETQSGSSWLLWSKEMPTGSLTLRFVFSGGRWDNKGGANYVVLSNDAWIRGGQVYYSDPDGDVIPPQVAITAPASGATVSGNVLVRATASDNKGVVRVEFLIDGSPRFTDETAPYEFPWMTTAADNGSRLITARAFDAAGNQASVDRQVTVNNQGADLPPVVSAFTAVNTNGSASLSATASDDIGVVSVAFYQGATLLGTDTSAPYSISVPTAAWTNGSYPVRAVATDTIGQTGERTATLVVNNQSGNQVTVHYKTSWANANIHYNGGSGWTTAPGEAMDGYRANWFRKTVTRTGASLTFVFNNGTTWDNNNSQNYTSTFTAIWVKDGQVYDSDPEGGSNTEVTVHYKTAWSAANIHYNGGAGWTTAPGEAMAPYRAGWFRRTVQRSGASLTFVFNNGTSWDNNGGNDYTSTLTMLWVRNGVITATDPEGGSDDTEAPVVSLTAPTAGAILTGAVTLSANATDNVAVTRVEFFAGSSLLATANSAPWSVSWNSAAVGNGQKSLSAKAYDAAGNVGTSATVLVTVTNQGGSNNHPGTYSGKLGANLYDNGVEYSIWWRSAVVSSVSVVGPFNGNNRSANPMTRISGGANDNVWWVFVPTGKAGDEYKFSGMKGGVETVVADPYSKYNRYSNGNSVVVNNSFNWEDGSWQRPGWSYYAIYELHVKDFTSAAPGVTAAHRGKYLGVIEKLDYLVNLGVTAIELMPINEFPDVGYSWGYNTALYFAPESGYAINPSQGQEGVDQLKMLVNEAHKRGIAVILDVVFNHTANNDNHLWTIDNVAYFDGQTPWGNRLNTAHPVVKRLGKDNIEYFMREFHIDGFRFDATGNGWVDYTFLHELKNHATSIDPNVYFVYENLPNNADLRTWGAQWSDSYHDKGIELLMDWNGRTAADFCPQIFYTKDEGWAASPVEALNYLESHDEDTLAHLAAIAGKGIEGARWRNRQAAVLLATSLGVPMLWMGQEFVRAREGQNTDEMPLDWSLATTHADVLNYYGGVFRLRREHPALRMATESGFTWQYMPWNAGADNNIVAYSLQTGNPSDKKFVVVLNFNENSRTVTVGFPSSGTWTKVITETGVGGTGTLAVSGSSAQVSIMGNSGIIYMQ